ncbi:hypothetical protein WME89_45930 [Sorangium sp. So ce321]|uniref:hypothetical protein n=1 Tax=Sorangium sp. So ce321 TaxID=3133300 RepID=UPI003F61CA96
MPPEDVGAADGIGCNADVCSTLKAMHAHKLIVHVPKSRRVEINLPEDVPEGEAEVIVLTQEQRDARSGEPDSDEKVMAACRAIDAWREDNPERLLSKDQLDAALGAERDSWGEP